MYSPVKCPSFSISIASNPLRSSPSLLEKPLKTLSGPLGGAVLPISAGTNVVSQLLGWGELRIGRVSASGEPLLRKKLGFIFERWIRSLMELNIWKRRYVLHATRSHSIECAVLFMIHSRLWRLFLKTTQKLLQNALSYSWSIHDFRDCSGKLLQRIDSNFSLLEEEI